MQSKFSVPLAALAERTKARIDVVVRKATFDLFTKVVLRSPVDTGRFRANWNVSYGTPDVSVTDSTVQGRANTEAAKALTLPLGGLMVMANGLPYARKLEYGYSKQAPGGMVRLSAAEFEQSVREALP